MSNTTQQAAAHTPGPWRVGIKHPCRLIAGDGNAAQVVGATVAFADEGTENEQERANAARIVACVNACEGVPTDTLTGPSALTFKEAGEELARFYEDARKLTTERNVLRAQRDELAALLREVLEAHDYELKHGGQVYTDGDKLRAALAKVQP